MIRDRYGYTYDNDLFGNPTEPPRLKPGQYFYGAKVPSHPKPPKPLREDLVAWLQASEREIRQLIDELTNEGDSK